MKAYLVLPVILATFLFGCSKLTQKNYDKLKTGMAFDEVEAILGKPTSCSEAIFTRNCTWGTEKRNVAVVFVGGKVILFSSTNLR